MERIDSTTDIVLLLDDYLADSQKLHNSFSNAEIDCPVLVINGDGFTPDGVIDIYGVMLGDFSKCNNSPGHPRYFNQIETPQYWEIASTNTSGNVSDMGKERARIYYTTPKNKRLVKLVEWLDEEGNVRLSDHYNKWGAVYARTIFSAKGERVNKSYFSAEGIETIVENYVTGAIFLKLEDEELVFASRTEYIIYALGKLGLADKRLFYNSLSYPFFVSQQLPGNHKGDVLFWQESRRDDIPGNMQIILSYQAKRTGRILVQKGEAYDKLLELGASPNIVEKLGNVYSFKKENIGTNNVLICTNSDQIMHLKDFVEKLPQLHFHIAALTEMSSELMSMDEYENVSLYKGVKSAVLDGLFMKCDFYLDINRYDEIVDAVYTAFLHNQLIFAFEETAHNRHYEGNDAILSADSWEELSTILLNAYEDSEKRRALLEKQKAFALAEGKNEFFDYLQIM